MNSTWLHRNIIFFPSAIIASSKQNSKQAFISTSFCMLSEITLQRLSWIALYLYYSHQSSTTGGFAAPAYWYNCHGYENKQSDPSITELPVWGLSVISSQSWANALILSNKGESAVAIGRHWHVAIGFLQSVFVETTNYYLMDRALSNTQYFTFLQIQERGK